MISSTFFPSPPLQHYVKCYHLRHFVFSPNIQLPFKPYAPRVEQTLTFYPRSHEVVEYVSSHQMATRPRSMVMGQYTERTNRHLGGSDFMVLIVEFHPGVLYRLLGLPFHELTNTFADAEALLPGGIKSVNERLSSTDDYHEMILIVEQFLFSITRRIRRNVCPADKVARLLMHGQEKQSVDSLAHASCLSERQFERTFKERMGIGPKLFARIARLNSACRMKYNNPHWDWLTIATHCHYHDYQHMSKEFKDLAGVTPLTYVREDSSAPETFFGLPDSSMVQ